MKFTLSWLKDHLDTAASLETVAETLTRIGLEVERVEDKAAALKPYVIARVLTAEQHPNADRLRVCSVETGEGAPVQVVCGAPNARAGMLSVFAPPGTYVPGKDITLSVGTIRGVESRGMLCSGAELGLGDDGDGILDLPADAPVGTPYAVWAGLDDPVIEINLTPNRPDCTSVHGIARDLAATGLGVLKREPMPPVRGEGPAPAAVTLDFDDYDRGLCPYFALRLVRGVRNGPSPDWMQARLRAIGLRPINALVDITNYMTFDRGRPLHVFDAAKVAGALTVRRAREGESLAALDGRTYALTDEMVVIADGNGVESIGGIIGGEATGCDESTTDVLIESALWSPANIAQTGRRLGIITDARYRFERGVDPAFALAGLDLATRLVTDICGGSPSDPAIAGEPPETSHVIDFPWTEVRRLAGIELSRAEMKVSLESLGFHIAGSGDRVKVLPPSWRPDIEGKADLVEEIVRIAGLDRIEPKPLPRQSHVATAVLTPLQKRTRLARRALASRGLLEAVTWSFIPREDAVLFGGGAPSLALANPIASELSDMRPSLVPGLLRAAQRNADRGYPDAALFEVGQCFASDEPEGQSIRAAAVRRGTGGHAGAGRHWDGAAGPVDAFEAKADAMALLAALGVPTGGLQVAAGGPAWLHPGRSGTLQFGPKTVVGHFGEVHPRVAKALGLKGVIVAFEITLDALPLPKHRPTKVKPALALSDFQPISRDFAFVVSRDVAAGEVVKAAASAERKLVTGVDVFDVYEGAGVPEGSKSVAIAVTLQPVEKTLTDAEIEAVSARIVAEVSRKTGATLRA
ncbi:MULTISPECIES: phenylalanine--tRNA ligase subunit beta [Methylobacterium]|uniref:Phenylalanine--tRNA ligase beta subunit n=3 Tax=Pseudomonadota TaxID=1224 RepID=A0ABQ4SS82_9HYPH|nr:MULTISPECIES: phenylalanine--tRNA ligase subunit beta [Methylobacterium]PIU04960.1 MAG: phenylalanine--tRNA ligase subunit beta [Methylobacterium sp. CG09_land_8_20_14_0_10_71_15]PIU11461.1 MAG: phenylalanine--tRNA ligase subunit beta [Methylobacterium sp. CG08_land_8_20_14_0_20_71_15]GBU18319.1 phenylalanine tRNA synthetase beta subunit [Methylobacterium sp.]GJE05962.1 Phenylalanine--tRNA ligase beta subunit [Methylobacterium jeotgali]